MLESNSYITHIDDDRKYLEFRRDGCQYRIELIGDDVTISRLVTPAAGSRSWTIVQTCLAGKDPERPVPTDPDVINDVEVICASALMTASRRQWLNDVHVTALLKIVVHVKTANA